MLGTVALAESRVEATTISATSKATIESYTKVVSTGQVMPWAVIVRLPPITRAA